MLGTLIRTQFLDNIFGIKFIVTFIVCAALVIATTMTGLGRYDGQLQETKDVDRMNRQSVKLADDWHSVARNGIKVVKDATWFSVFSSGLEESVGRTATVKEGDFPRMEDSIYSTAPIFAVFGDLDLTFIIKIVISLFAILFTYDIISGEKERGTLRLCLSNSVPRNTFILGKSIGSFLSLLLPLVIPLLISLILVMVFGNLSLSGEDWARLSVIVLGYTLYLLAFFSLGIFVSSITKHSAVSFLVLLFLWVFFVLVVPKGAMMLAEQMYDVPDINEVRAKQSDNQRMYWQDVRDNAFNEFRQKYPTASDDFRQMRQLMWPIMQKWRDELKSLYDGNNKKLVTDFKDRQGVMTTAAMNISRISPASAVTYIGMNMSGTGYVEQEHFLDRLAVYRDTLTQFFDNEENREESSRPRGPHGFGPRTQDIVLDYNSIPRFEPTRLSFSEALQLALPDLLTMALISIIFYALGFVLFLRYDVR